MEDVDVKSSLQNLSESEEKSLPSGEKPEDFGILEVAGELNIGYQRHPVTDAPILVAAAVVQLPVDLFGKTPVIYDAAGNLQPSERMRRALGGRPNVRFILRRECLESPE